MHSLRIPRVTKVMFFVNFEMRTKKDEPEIILTSGDQVKEISSGKILIFDSVTMADGESDFGRGVVVLKNLTGGINSLPYKEDFMTKYEKVLTPSPAQQGD